MSIQIYHEGYGVEFEYIQKCKSEERVFRLAP